MDNKSRIRAVLFDMDGVLIDAKEWHYEALNKALMLFGISISRYEHIHSFDGLPTSEKLKMLSEQIYLPQKLHGFINEMKQMYTMELIQERCSPIFQHEYALARLKNEGYVIAVCSNSIRKTIETMMEKAGLISYIDLIMSNEDVSHAKPDPEIYTRAMETLGFDPAQCLILEDNKNGIRAATDSGAWLLKIGDVWDVNYSNISQKIHDIESITQKGQGSDGSKYTDTLSRSIRVF